ncbi:MAG: glycosyltransferase [Christensenellaceae bacterium]|jgi:GT2 family glycosyltransferase|nr:glycosyltransferase [Christensenellaceae bacterium]
MKHRGIEQIKTFFDALLAPPESASLVEGQEEEPYAAYLRQDMPDAAELQAQRDNPPELLPRFAIVLPASGDKKARAVTLASLNAQTYARWELTEDPLRAQGEFILFLQPGDTLAPHALYCFASAAQAGADLLYCDEDIRINGRQAAPYFKGEASLITQYSYDMLGSGVAAALPLYRAAGGRQGAGAEDRYAYNLRLLQTCAHPLHIGQVLYTCAKEGHPATAARRMLQGCLPKDTYAATGMFAGSFRVEHTVKTPQVAIIVPNKNNMDALRRLLESLEMHTLYQNYTILIADEGTRDNRTLRYYDILQKNKAAAVLFGGGVSLPALLNRAAREVNADVLVFLGRDTEVITPNWLRDLLSQLYRRNVAAVGGKLVDARGRLLYVGGVVGLGGWVASPYAGSADDMESLRKNRFANSIHAVSALSLACMAVRAETFFNAGCFDESFLRDGIDMELCLRLLRRDLTCVYTPYAVLRSHAPLPDLRDADQKDKVRCYDTLRPMLLRGDPYYSRGYDYSCLQPTVAARPRPAIELNERYR